MPRITALFCAVSVWLVAATASAQGTGQSRAEKRLFFVTATVGFGDCNDTDCGGPEVDGSPSDRETSPSFGTGAGIYVRPIPYFAAGLDLHYNFMAADHFGGGRTDEHASYWLANLAVRGIIPVGIAELWGGLGLGLAGWSFGWTRDGDEDEDIDLSGWDLALSLGADFRVADRWWIGGMFRFAFPFWGERCRERVEPGRTDLECRDWEQLDPDDQEELTDLLWYTGFTGRFDF
jgi:hypothetical protein